MISDCYIEKMYRTSFRTVGAIPKVSKNIEDLCGYIFIMMEDKPNGKSL